MNLLDCTVLASLNDPEAHDAEIRKGHGVVSGVVCCKPNACRRIAKTIIMRVKDVIISKNDGSNVSAVSAMVEMIELARQFESEVNMLESAEEIDSDSIRLMRME